MAGAIGGTPTAPIPLGAATLWAGGGALALAVALALANILGALPGLVRLIPYMAAPTDRALLRRRRRGGRGDRGIGHEAQYVTTLARSSARAAGFAGLGARRVNSSA